jgi:hypothetical protein
MQYADDSWHSFLKNQPFGIAPTGTSIYKSWYSALIAGRYYGPPISHEYETVDVRENPIIAQEFAHARAEFRDGVVSWHGPNGEIV